MSHLLAAEWSLQPIVSVLTDYDSDRNLAPEGTSGSEEMVLATDLRLQRAIENTQIVIEPRFDVRRYSASIWGPGNDRSLNTAFSYLGPRSKFSFSASIADQTTLTTEVFETGIISGSTRRRSPQANTEWDWSQSERRQAFVQASYLGASYSGTPLVELELPGYHYTSGAVGERFFLSERWTLSPSVFGDVLTSARQGGSSHEEGAQVEVSYQYSERMLFDVAVGESERTLSSPSSPGSQGSQGSLSHQTNSGTNISVSAAQTLERGSTSLTYLRSLVPYGTGFLVQRQQITAALTRPLAPTLDFTLSLLRIQNNAATVRLGLDRPYYNNAQVGLNWKMGESWTLQPAFTASSSKPSPPVSAPTHPEPTVFQWRAAVTLIWQPLPAAKSR